MIVFAEPPKHLSIGLIYKRDFDESTIAFRVIRESYATSYLCRLLFCSKDASYMKVGVLYYFSVCAGTNYCLLTDDELEALLQTKQIKSIYDDLFAILQSDM